MPPRLTAAVPTWRSCLQVPSAGLWAQCMYLDPATFAVVSWCHWDAGVQPQNGEDDTSIAPWKA